MKQIVLLSILTLLICVPGFAQQTAIGPDGIPVGHEADNASVENTPFTGSRAPTWFFEGFENNDFNQWTVLGGTYIRGIDSLDPATGKYCFTQAGGANTHLDGVSYSFAPDQVVNVSFNVKFSGPQDENGAYFLLGHQQMTVSNCIAFFFFSMVGAMRMFTGFDDIQVPYVAGLWYKVELRDINYSTKTFDFLIDDVVYGSGVNFRGSTITSSAMVHLYNFNNTQAWYDDIIISSYNVGQEEQPEHKRLLAFPNPTTGQVNIAGTGTITVTDMLGNLLLTEKNTQQLDLSAYPAGTYIITVTNDREVVADKIVLTK